jgi:Transcription elongation factor, GreA/GreB, C-term
MEILAVLGIKFRDRPRRLYADLFETLERFHIHPLGDSDGSAHYAEHRTMPPVDSTAKFEEPTQIEMVGGTEKVLTKGPKRGEAPNGIGPGDRIVVRYLDDNKTATFTLSNERNDPTNGLLSVMSPLGKQLLGLVEEDETEFEVDGHMRPVLIVRAERQPAMSH